MKMSKFNNLDIMTSLLGFGCMRFPLNDDGTIDEKEAEKMIDKAMEDGVNYIDTAYPYHGGDSEPFVGKVLNKYKREDYFLATKLPIWQINSKEEARKIFDEQLERLDKDYVDFYLLHALDKGKWDKVIKYDIIAMCEDLLKEGKIKYLGFSFHDTFDVFEQIINYRKWDFCQLQLNYMDMDEEIQAGRRGYELAEKLNVPVVVMEPIKGGSLASLPKDVELIFNEYNDKSMASWALRYVGSMPNVKVILSGMSTYQQVLDNLDTFNNFEPLNDEEQKLISEAKTILKSRTMNGCTGCEYCMPCPFGVDIPTNFRYWNTANIYEQHDSFKKKLSDLSDKFASNCQECGACESMCPQQLQIIEDLKRVVKYVGE